MKRCAYNCGNYAEYYNSVTDDDVCYECMKREIVDNEWGTSEEDYINLNEIELGGNYDK